MLSQSQGLAEAQLASRPSEHNSVLVYLDKQDLRRIKHAKYTMESRKASGKEKGGEGVESSYNAPFLRDPSTAPACSLRTALVAAGVGSNIAG